MPPINDNFADATTISGLSGTATFSNVGATVETGEPGGPPNGTDRSVWFAWTPTVDGPAAVWTSATPLPEWDTYIWVFTGTSFADFAFVANDDDGELQAGATGPYGTSRVTWPALAGTTYWIQVSSYDDLTPAERSDAVLSWQIDPVGVTSFAPTAGPIGTVVDLYGHGFDDVTDVTISGVSQTWTPDSDTHMQITIVTGTTTAPVELHTVHYGTVDSARAFFIETAPHSGWFRPSTSEWTDWVSANCVDRFGTAHATTASYQKVTTYQDSGGTYHDGEFSLDPVTTFSYAKVVREWHPTIRLESAEMQTDGMWFNFSAYITANAPAGWTGDIEYELPDGTVTAATPASSDVGTLLLTEPIEVSAGPTLRPIVADETDTPYSDSEYSSARAGNSLNIPGIGAWDIPPTNTGTGPSPPPAAVKVTVSFVDDGFGATVFTPQISGTTWTGHYAVGKWGLQGAGGFVETLVLSGSPRMFDHSYDYAWGATLADGDNTGQVGWRAKFQPIRYRYVLSSVVELWAHVEGSVTPGAEIWG